LLDATGAQTHQCAYQLDLLLDTSMSQLPDYALHAQLVSV